MLISRRLSTVIPTILLLSSVCSSAQDSGSMEDRVKQLEARIAVLEQKVSQSLDKEAREAQAVALLRQAQSLNGAGKTEDAKAAINELFTKYSGTQAQRQAVSLQQELAVVGKSAPASYEIDQWLQGQDAVDFNNGKPTLIVFWELWCPHCRREVPKLQQMYTKYGSKMQMVGLTKLTRNTTLDAVKEFIGQQNVSYPMAKENGKLSAYFGVSGIPAAAFVKDGKVIWRGHPAQLTDGMIDGWVGG